MSEHLTQLRDDLEALAAALRAVDDVIADVKARHCEMYDGAWRQEVRDPIIEAYRTGTAGDVEADVYELDQTVYTLAQLISWRLDEWVDGVDPEPETTAASFHLPDDYVEIARRILERSERERRIVWSRLARAEELEAQMFQMLTDGLDDDAA